MPRAGAGGHPCQGLYWTPEEKRPRIALIATHYNVDFAEHYSAPYFAARGFGFLGWNTRYRGAEDLFHLEHALTDIGVGVKWLRDQGVEKIVLLGNSGGGSLMAAYQAEASAPTLDAKGAMAAALSSLPKGDLYISLNAHPGRPEVLTNWMDASVIDETDPVAMDAKLDPFNPGPSYSDEFIARYRAAQRARVDLGAGLDQEGGELHDIRRQGHAQRIAGDVVEECRAAEVPERRLQKSTRAYQRRILREQAAQAVQVTAVAVAVSSGWRCTGAAPPPPRRSGAATGAGSVADAATRLASRSKRSAGSLTDTAPWSVPSTGPAACWIVCTASCVSSCWPSAVPGWYAPAEK